MVKMTESDFNEKKFYYEQGKEFVARVNAFAKDSDNCIALGKLVHDLPRNMSKFKRETLVATHRDHETFKKLVVDVQFVLRQMGEK